MDEITEAFIGRLYLLFLSTITAAHILRVQKHTEEPQSVYDENSDLICVYIWGPKRVFMNHTSQGINSIYHISQPLTCYHTSQGGAKIVYIWLIIAKYQSHFIAKLFLLSQIKVKLFLCIAHHTLTQPNNWASYFIHNASTA